MDSLDGSILYIIFVDGQNDIRTMGKEFIQKCVGIKESSLDII